jgi:hypothetical protein
MRTRLVAVSLFTKKTKWLGVIDSWRLLEYCIGQNYTFIGYLYSRTHRINSIETNKIVSFTEMHGFYNEF